jgi:predicted nucleic acid-binding protein
VRIFLDANILFSGARAAHAGSGAVRELLLLVLDSGHECVVSDHVVAEARRNLEIKGDASAILELERLIGRLTVVSSPSGRRRIPIPRSLPEKDRPVLAAAVAGRCDVLLTGDRRHFGRYFGRRVAGLAIHSPSSLVAVLWPSG